MLTEEEKITGQAELVFKPMLTPNFVNIDGAEQSLPIRNLTQETLDALAGRFLNDLYDKAGKHSPWVKE